MDFASGKRLSFHFQIHVRINICSVERDVQAPEFNCCEFGVYRHVRFGGCNVSLGVRVPLAP